MKILLCDDASLEIDGYNKVLEDRLIEAISNDRADEAAKIFHIMLCDSGMGGDPHPDLQEYFVNELVSKSKPVFLDATGKPKQDTCENEFQIGILEDVSKYLGLGTWDDPNNLVKSDEFYLSTLYTRYGHDNVEDAIDYLEGDQCQ